MSFDEYAARTAPPSPSAVKITLDPALTSKWIQAQHSLSRSTSSISAATAPGVGLKRMPPGNEVALDEAATGTGVGWAPETARERSACLESLESASFSR